MKKAEKTLRENVKTESIAKLQEILAGKVIVMCKLTNEARIMWNPELYRVTRRYIFFVAIEQDGYRQVLNITPHIAHITNYRFIASETGHSGLAITNGYYTKIIRDVQEAIGIMFKYESML